MTITEKRRAIRPLLSEREPADALAAYYAFYHPENKTQLITGTLRGGRAQSYIAVSRTGIDLFRPLITLRLAEEDSTANMSLIYEALSPGSAVILHSPERYLPLLQALFDIQAEEQLDLFVLDSSRFKPIVNVLVSQSDSSNGLPRFVIRSVQNDNQVVASAGLNWQSPYFADIAVHTSPTHRRQGWGRSVVAAQVQNVLSNGRIPLYAVSVHNQVSRQLAAGVGFINSGIRQVILQATLRTRL